VWKQRNRGGCKKEGTSALRKTLKQPFFTPANGACLDKKQDIFIKPAKK
jgi:hypothetical protein